MFPRGEGATVRLFAREPIEPASPVSTTLPPNTFTNRSLLAFRIEPAARIVTKFGEYAVSMIASADPFTLPGSSDGFTELTARAVLVAFGSRFKTSGQPPPLDPLAAPPTTLPLCIDTLPPLVTDPT